MQYKVLWITDVEAPDELTAARVARTTQLNSESVETVFYVVATPADADSEILMVDAAEDDGICRQ